MRLPHTANAVFAMTGAKDIHKRDVRIYAYEKDLWV